MQTLLNNKNKNIKQLTNSPPTFFRPSNNYYNTPAHPKENENIFTSLSPQKTKELGFTKVFRI